MKKPYHIVNKDAKSASESIAQFAKANGQALLPLVELVTQARVAVDEVIHTIGRQTIETILTLSAQEVAGAHSGQVERGGTMARIASRTRPAGRPSTPSETPAAPA